MQVPPPAAPDRAAVTTTVRAAVDAVLAGTGSTVVVVGDAGIGKSALTAPTVEDSAVRGAVVVRAGDRRDRLLRPHGLADRVLGGLPETDPTDAVLAHLDDLADGRAVVLLVEDADTLDVASLRALRRICWTTHDVPLAVVVTARPRTDLPVLDAVVDRADAALTVPAMTPAEVEEFAAGLVSGPMADHAELLAGTGGNPLLVRELLEDLSAGAVGVTDGSGTPTLETVARAQLARLDPDARAVVDVLAVLGTPTTWDVLAAVSRRPAVWLDRPVRAAERAGAVVWLPGDVLGVRHDSVRQVAYDDLSAPARRAEHRRVAAVLLETGAAPEIVAPHLARGARRGDPDAIGVLQDAARRVGRFDPETSAQVYGDIAALLPGDAIGADLPSLDDVVTDQVTALFLGGRNAAAERRAADWLPRTPDPRVRARLVALMTRSQIDRADVDAARHSITATLEVPTLPAASRRELLALRSWVEVLGGDRAAAAATVAEVEPTLTDDDVMSSHTASTTTACLAYLDDRPADAVRAIREPVTGTDDDLPLAGRMTALVWPPGFVLETDGVEAARASLDRARRRAAERGALWLGSFLSFTAGGIAVEAGDWDDALAEIGSGLELATDRGTGWISRPTGNAAYVLAHRGDTAGARRHLEDFAHADVVLHFGLDEPGRAALALAEAENDPSAPDRATALWEAAAGAGRWWQRRVAADVVRVAVVAGDRALAERVAADLAWTAAHDVAAVRLVGAQVRAAVRGDAPGLVAAAAGLRDLGRRPAAAAADEEAAVAALSVGDDRTATTAFDRAAAAYESFGARADLARLAARARAHGLRRRRPGRRDVAAHGWDALTPTENRVVELVAEGLTNPQIAARMFLSPRTVQTHVSHVLRKVGLRSRVEVVRAAATRPPSA